MYIQTRPPTHRGGGHTIDTHIHTYIQIHTYTHTCMYIQTRPPNPQGGGGGKTTCNRPAPPIHIDPCAPRPFGGGGGVGPADLDHIYIYIGIMFYVINIYIMCMYASYNVHLSEVLLMAVIEVPRCTSKICLAQESRIAAAMLWSDREAKAPISLGLGPMSIKTSLRICMAILWLNQLAAALISFISLPFLDPGNANLRDPAIYFVCLATCSQVL